MIRRPEEAGVPAELPKGVFTVSLDFELAWGTRGRPSASRVGPDLDGTREAIDRLLALFEKYDISATWVVVGALFLGGPKRHRWLDDPQYDDVPLGDCRSHPHWFAEDVLGKLRQATPAQEIGCHTLTHIFVDDTPAGRRTFDVELSRSVELFSQLGLPAPKSFIFPKHYMAHFDLLRKHGFACYRGPETGWFEHLPHAVPRAAGRLAWARLRRPPVIEQPRKTADGLWMIPSSQYFPGFQNVGRHISLADRVAKGKKGLDRAAERRGVHHLWTHPFNLGQRTTELLSGLDAIFQHAARLRDQGRLVFRSMAGVAELLDEGSGIRAVEQSTNDLHQQRA